MECPICNFSELSAGATSCSACHSDLEVFDHLKDARKQHYVQKKYILILSILLAIVAVGWGATRFLSDDEPQGNRRSIILSAPAVPDSSGISPLEEELKKTNETLIAENNSLREKMNSLNEKLTSNESSSANNAPIIHVVKNGETLWIIAKKYFHDGRKYKQIAKDNNLPTAKKIRIGMKLKINK